MDILNRITTLRDERGWTNNRMSVEAEIGSATVINWYNRKTTPSLDAIIALCGAFGISIAEFFNESPERLSLSDVQKDFLDDFDQLNKDEKHDLHQFVKTMNKTRKRFQ